MYHYRVDENPYLCQTLEKEPGPTRGGRGKRARSGRGTRGGRGGRGGGGKNNGEEVPLPADEPESEDDMAPPPRTVCKPFCVFSTCSYIVTGICGYCKARRGAATLFGLGGSSSPLHYVH